MLALPLAASFIATAAVSCSTQIKDLEFCGDLGADGATCFHTLTPASRNVSKTQWDASRFGMICTSGDAVAEIKREIEQLCSVTSCDYNTQASIAAFFARAQAVRAKAVVK